MKIENKIAKVEKKKIEMTNKINRMIKINNILTDVTKIVIGIGIGYIIWGVK